MKIALLNERVTFQKNSVTVDSVGNHKNEWTDYFSCSAYVSTRKQGESEEVGVVTEKRGFVFTVRYCSELSSLDSTHYRAIFRDEPYNITSIDMMNFQHKSIKITCERERENGD